MKKRLALSTQNAALDAPAFAEPLIRLQALQKEWNRKIGDVLATRNNMPEALPTMLEHLGLHCGDLLASMEAEVMQLRALPEMRKVMASLVECKKMEIRRAAIAATEMVEKHTQKRLHTHLFFAAHDGMAFGEGLDEYKDIMEELMRRLKLMVRMRTLDDTLMQRLIMELKNAHELFHKKRVSILEKADIPAEYLPHFAALVDDALMMLKPKMNYHQVSLATFHPENAIKRIAENMGEFFDEVHHGECHNAYALPQSTAGRRRRGAKTMMPPMQGGMMERRASA